MVMRVDVEIRPVDVADGICGDHEACSLLLRAIANTIRKQDVKSVLHWFACGHIPDADRDAIRRLGELLVKAADSA